MSTVLLTMHTGSQPGRSHEGKVITLRSNLRWSDDSFEIGCWNGEKVRGVFVLDCCDCEVRFCGLDVRNLGLVGARPDA